MVGQFQLISVFLGAVNNLEVLKDVILLLICTSKNVRKYVSLDKLISRRKNMFAGNVRIS